MENGNIKTKKRLFDPDQKLTNLFIVEGAGVVTFAAIMLFMYIFDITVYTYDPALKSWGWGAAPDSVTMTFLGRCITTLPIWIGLDLLMHGYDLGIKRTQVDQDHSMVKMVTKWSYRSAIAMFVFTLFLAMRG